MPDAVRAAVHRIEVLDHGPWSEVSHVRYKHHSHGSCLIKATVDFTKPIANIASGDKQTRPRRPDNDNLALHDRALRRTQSRAVEDHGGRLDARAPAWAVVVEPGRGVPPGQGGRRDYRERFDEEGSLVQKRQEQARDDG